MMIQISLFAMLVFCCVCVHADFRYIYTCITNKNQVLVDNSNKTLP